MQYAVDRPYNNFPSLHVSLATYSYLLLFHARRKLGWLLLAPYLLILASPLFVKQHFLLDVLGGLALAGAGFLVYRRMTRDENAGRRRRG
jgi:membrane-associated phospholipid phosphatase